MQAARHPTGDFMLTIKQLLYVSSWQAQPLLASSAIIV